MEAFMRLLIVLPEEARIPNNIWSPDIDLDSRIVN
jgi:hypothetical protein